MTVRINRPSFNLREKLNHLDKPSGVAGEAMLRAETAEDQFNLIGAGRKNILINGGFDIWQRGETLNTTDYSADRWMQWMTNSGVSNRNVNCTRQRGGPLGKNASYIRWAPQVTDTGMEKFSWGQKIEKANLDHIKSGQKLTLSFWIKREGHLPVDNPMDIQIIYPNSTDGWGTGYLFRGDTNIDQTIESIQFNSLSTEWTKYSFTFIPSDTSLDRGFAVYWHVGDTNFNLGNTNPLISFTGAQLEVGEVATPFEQRSFAEELTLCQRYYAVPVDSLNEDGNTNVMSAIGVGRGAASGVVVVFALHSPVPMRDRPGISSSGTYYITDGTSRVAAAPTGISISQFSPNSTIMLANYQFSSAVCDDDRVNMVGAQTAVKITLDAEL